MVSFIFAGVIDMSLLNMISFLSSYNKAPRLERIRGFSSIRISLSMKTEVVFPLTPVTSILIMSPAQSSISSPITS